MSRIGRLPIEIPAGVTVKIGDANEVVVKGAKGELTRKFNNDMKIEVEGNQKAFDWQFSECLCFFSLFPSRHPRLSLLRGFLPTALQ